MCWQCNRNAEDDYYGDDYDEREAYQTPVEKPKPVFESGMQYREGFLGEWQDITEGQTAFDVTDKSRIEFRRKPSVVGSFDNLDGSSAQLFTEEGLILAIKKRIERGEQDFDLKVRFKK